MTTDEQTTVYVISMLGCWDISVLSSYALFTSTSTISNPEKPRRVVHEMDRARDYYPCDHNNNDGMTTMNVTRW